MNKCCWTECENDSCCSISNNLNKGRLDMCNNCFDKFQKHCNARERLFIKDFGEVLKKEIKKENSTNPDVNAIISRGQVIDIINKSVSHKSASASSKGDKNVHG